MENKQKVYIVCDSCNGIIDTYEEFNVDFIDYLNRCDGRILTENGSLIGKHTSNSIRCLRKDLKEKLDDQSKYEIIDLIGKHVDAKFRLNLNLNLNNYSRTVRYSVFNNSGKIEFYKTDVHPHDDNLKMIGYTDIVVYDRLSNAFHISEINKYLKCIVNGVEREFKLFAGKDGMFKIEIME